MGYLLTDLCGEVFWIGSYAYSPQIQAVCIKAGIDCRVARSVCRGMQSAGFLQELHLFVGDFCQIGFSQGIDERCCSWPVFQVSMIGLSAGIVKIGYFGLLVLYSKIFLFSVLLMRFLQIHKRFRSTVFGKEWAEVEEVLECGLVGKSISLPN